LQNLKRAFRQDTLPNVSVAAQALPNDFSLCLETEGRLCLYTLFMQPSLWWQAARVCGNQSSRRDRRNALPFEADKPLFFSSLFGTV
jgi:hypothetical protein